MRTKVSLKSKPTFCWDPFPTKCDLHLSAVALVLGFTLNTHLHSITSCLFVENGTRCHVSCFLEGKTFPLHDLFRLVVSFVVHRLNKKCWLTSHKHVENVEVLVVRQYMILCEPDLFLENATKPSHYRLHWRVFLRLCPHDVYLPHTAVHRIHWFHKCIYNTVSILFPARKI